MVDKLFADTHLQGASPQVGMSQPVLIKADNGRTYFLKTNLVNGQHQDAVFFQELLCSLLAERLNVPVPNFAIIEIEKEFIENNPFLRFNGRFKEGLYFATEEIDGAESNLRDNYSLARQNGQPKIRRAWNSYFKNISNSDQIANIIAFDLFVYNFDRFSNEGNILVGKEPNGGRKLYAIDHGHCFFGPCYKEYLTQKHGVLEINKFDIQNQQGINHYIQWHMNQLIKNGQPLGLGSIFSGLEQNVDFTNGNPFFNFVHTVEALGEDELMALLNAIPEIWVSGGEIQKNLYLNFLLRQKYLIRTLLDYMAVNDAFSNHVGGVLDWSKSEELHGTL